MKAVNNKFINKINLVIILLVIPLLSFYLVSCSLFKGAEKEEVTAGVEVEFEIKEGMTLKEIASLLEEKGVIDNAFLFRLFVEQENKDKNLLPGKYKLLTGSDYQAVLDKITTGVSETVYKLAIPEGYTVEETRDRILTDIFFIEAADLNAALDVGNYNYEFLKDKTTLEGFLFPKTYDVTIKNTAQNIVEMMLDQYQLETGSLDYSYATENNFTPYDILIIASMIEEETYVPEERPKISAVIYNRLKINMLLQIDATVRYALNKWDGDLTLEDLEVDSPYNTYKYAGLPPIPICSPGLASIKAALNPEDVDYLYYVVNDEVKHTHSFSNTLEEHERNRNNTN